MKEQSCPSDILNKILYTGRKNDIWRVGSDWRNQNGLQIYAMQDHDGAGKVWDRAYQDGIISNAALVHVDAHDDLALRFPLPHTFTELINREYEVGSFILPRVNVGIIDKIVWIMPFTRQEPPLDLPTKQLFSSVIQFPQSILSKELVHNPNVTMTSKIPQTKADLVDIDLDFFTSGLPEWYPNCLLKIRVKNFLTRLFNSVGNPKIITVATSPGYIQIGRERVLLDTTLKAISHFRQ